MAPRFTVVGGISRDTIVHVDALPEIDATAPALAVHVGPGGKGRNQAATLARLGCDVALIACCGRDDAGDEAVADLQVMGVDTTGIERSRWPTGHYVAMVDRAVRSVSTWASGANDTLAPAAVRDSRRVLGDATHLLVQFEVPDAPIAAALALTDARVVVDASPDAKRAEQFLDRAWLLRANACEASVLSGVEVRDEATARRAAAVLMDRGPDWVALSAGASGDLLAGRAGAWWVPAPDTPVVDTTGAGDALVATVVARLAVGAPPETAASAGAHAAAATMSRLGA